MKSTKVDIPDELLDQVILDFKLQLDKGKEVKVPVDMLLNMCLEIRDLRNKLNAAPNKTPC